MQCGIERPVLHLQKIVRGSLDMLPNLVAVGGAMQQRPQDEHVQRSLKQLRPLLFLLSGHGRRSTLECTDGRHSTTDCQVGPSRRARRIAGPGPPAAKNLDRRGDNRRVRPATRLLITLALALGAAAQIPSSLYSGLVWRPIGTFRAGRVSAVGGALGRPGLFYMGAMQGGLWKSTNAGVTWVNVTDALPDVANVSAVVVAPSNSETIYFGTNARGPGMFRSDDGARTWRRLGLGDQRGVTAIVVDPHNPALVLAATGGGVFRSTDAGAHWSHTLGEQPALAAEEMAAPFDHPDVIFVSAGAARGGRGARGAGRGGAGGGLGLYRSGDEGLTWTRVEP